MQKYLVALGVVTFLFIVPLTVGAADLVTCGGPNDAPCNSCDAVIITNNVISWLVLILGTIAAILIVVAGARLVVSGGNTSAKEKAKSSITNLIIGYVIVLSAWLVLDYGLKALLVQDGTYSFGVWNQVSCISEVDTNFREVTQTPVEWIEYTPIDASLSNTSGWTYVSAGGAGGGGDSNAGTYTAPCTRSAGPANESTYSCATQQTQCRAAGGTPTLNAAQTVVTCTPQQVVVNGGTGGSLPQCTNSACSVAVLRAAGLSNSQANVMSCIAMTESTGNPNARTTVPGSSACGTFQITRSTWSDFNPGGTCASHNSCTNANCNIKTMVNIVRSVGYSRWTCPNCNAKARPCIQRYGG